MKLEDLVVLIYDTEWSVYLKEKCVIKNSYTDYFDIAEYNKYKSFEVLKISRYGEKILVYIKENNNE